MADLVPYEGKKKKTSGSGTKKCLPLEKHDTSAILTMAIEASAARMGRPAEYPNTQKGLDDFINKTIDYFQYVNAVNESDDLDRKLIVDIESWACFCGLTRQTIWTYEKRGGEWRDVIEYYKGVIQATKKQLAYNFKVPPSVFIFDSCNNAGYVNSNEFKLTDVRQETTDNNIDDKIRAAGLVWNEDIQDFEPLEG